MVHKYTTKSTSLNHANVVEPIVLHETTTTRRIFLAEINDNPEKVDQQQTVSGKIIHQRKHKSDEWEDIASINLNTLKAGEGVKLDITSEQTRLFYDALTELYKLSLKGVQLGNAEYTVGRSSEIIEAPAARQEFIKKLLEANHGEDVWNQLISRNPDLATRLSLAQVQSSRQKVLDEFQENLTKDNDESYWQNFFEKNPWIFGYGLKYKFLNLIDSQPNYGGANFTGKGGQRGDYLLNSEAEIKFTVLVEIKKPNTPILSVSKNDEEKKYRNGAYLLSSELIGSVSQVQVNCKTWLRKSVEPENNDELSKNDIFTVNPRGIVVIGNTSQFSCDRSKIETFEIFRNELNNPEVITFDELFERAKFIVEHNATPQETPVIEDTPDEIPF
jgi:hypothetical protein